MYQWYEANGFDSNKGGVILGKENKFGLKLSIEELTLVTWLRKTNNPYDVFVIIEVGLGMLSADLQLDAMRYFLEFNVGSYSQWKYGVGPRGYVMLTRQYWMKETNIDFVIHLINNSLLDGKDHKQDLSNKGYLVI